MVYRQPHLIQNLNRRLLAFYNICAEYKKAIFQVSAQMSYVDKISQRGNGSGKENEEGTDCLVFKL